MPPTPRPSIPWALYALTLLSALPMAAVLAAATPQPPGACSGIGFGCSLYGWDAAGFALMLFGLPWAFGLGVILKALSLLGRRWVHVTTATAVVGLVVPWSFVAVVLLGG